jgi:hypothetical protein
MQANNKEHSNDGAQKAWIRVGEGIWRRTSNGLLYERPKIRGKWTYRSLKSTNIKLAREEKQRRERNRGTKTDCGNIKVGDIILRYLADECPNQQGHPRTETDKRREKYRCSKLLAFWDKIKVDEISLNLCDDYHASRQQEIAKRNKNNE